MKKITTPFAVAMGAALISSISATAANAEVSLFGATELSSGYMQLAAAEMACGAGMKMEKPKTEAKTKAVEGKCGDMMDGDKMKKGMESSCGAMMKGKEGSCGDMHGAMMKEGACGGAMAGMGDMKAKEGSCGDQCKDNMKNCPDAKNKEGACGAKMQGCGEDMKGCGEMSKGKDGSCGAAMSGVKPSSGKALDNSPLYDVLPPKK